MLTSLEVKNLISQVNHWQLIVHERSLDSLSETEEFDERLCSASQHCRLHHVKALSWQPLIVHSAQGCSMVKRFNLFFLLGLQNFNKNKYVQQKIWNKKLILNKELKL